MALPSFNLILLLSAINLNIGHHLKFYDNHLKYYIFS